MLSLIRPDSTERWAVARQLVEDYAASFNDLVNLKKLATSRARRLDPSRMNMVRRLAVSCWLCMGHPSSGAVRSEECRIRTAR